MKAHDVRHLRICKGCGSLGDDREMIRAEEKDYHGDCIFKLIGIDGIMALPRGERAKFRLGEIGPEVMKRLVDAAMPSTNGERE